MTEIEKYKGIYASREFRNYGHDCVGAKSIPLLGEFESLLDVGCGHNEFAKKLRRLFPNRRVVGVDFACPSADIIADATALPFNDKSFSVVTSFDALEHLLPNQVEAALLEMSRIASRYVVSICYRDSVFKWMGHTLHPSVFPEAWWMNELKKAGCSVTKSGRYLFGDCK